jgi:hypothetical protein
MGIKANPSGRVWAIVAFGFAIAGAQGCGSSSKSAGGSNGAGAGKTPGGGDPSDPGLSSPALSLQGGSATSAGGQGQAGGTAHLVSSGGITIGPDFTAPAIPVAAPPGDAHAVASGDLGADVSAPGAISISGNVSTQGADAVRQIVAGGDIFVTGTLRSADLGGTRQGLTLKAMSGTVYVSGALDTSGAAGPGQAGGPLTIVAQRVVVSGKLVTTGGSGATAGGQGGGLAIQATGDVVLGGTTAVNGGAATGASGGNAQAGDAGAVTIDASGTVAFTGTFDGRGGSTAANGGRAGAAAALKVGETTRPAAIGVSVPLLVKGGDGISVGGAGGTANLEAHGGDLRVSGLVDASGGDSASMPGAGGAITGTPGPETATAGFDVAGQVVSNGGALSSGGSGRGADGGTIKLIAAATDGGMTVEPAGQVQTDGGAASGAATAGGGGKAYLFTIHGDASIHGKLLARGGDAADPGGTGGGGGLVYVFTGNAHDRMSGILIIETDGTVDASGGAGTTGGSARNNGAGGVGTFPSNQNDELDVEQIAVLINSDGVHGSDKGWIDNRGQVLARGGVANGDGGDVIFHGKRQDGNETPVPGNVVDNSGNGSGRPGDFAGE